MSELKFLLRLNCAMRSMLGSMLETIEDSDFYAQPTGGGNSPGWILGHIVVGHRFGAALLGGPAVPEAELAMFGPGSTHPQDPSTYPAKQTLIALEQEQGNAFVALCETVDSSTLEQPQQSPFLQKEMPLVGDLVGHLLTSHLSLHMGQLSAWRRSRGMDSILKI